MANLPVSSGNAVERPGTGAGLRTWLALALILALALGLRLYRLDASLWYDEVLTLVRFVRLPFGQLVSTYDSLNNHMLFSIFAKLSVTLFGEAAWSLRLPAVIFGVLSIPVHWQVARRYVGDREALVLALLLAISYHHIWFSQNARGYTMLLFFTSLSALHFLVGLEDRRRASWIVFALASAAAIYTHLSALFFYAALALVYAAALGAGLLRKGEGREGQVPFVAPVVAGSAALLIALLLNLPILASVVSTVGEVSEATSEGGTGLVEWQNPLRALVEIGRSIGTLGPLVAPALLGAAVTITVGAVALARRAPLLVGIYCMQIPVTVGILTFLDMRIWPRFFFNEIGVFYLFAVHGTFVIVAWASRIAVRQVGWKGAQTVLAGAAVIAMVVVSAALLPRNYRFAKQPFVTARDYVEAQMQPGDRVAAIGRGGYALEHYFRPGWRQATDRTQLAAIDAAPGRSWLIVAFPSQTVNADPAMMHEVERRYDRVETLTGTLGDGAIWIYRSKS